MRIEDALKFLKKTVGAPALVCLALLAPPAAWAAAPAETIAVETTSGTLALTNAQCIECHGDPKLVTLSPEALAGQVAIPPGLPPLLRAPDEIAGLYFSPESFTAGAHGKMQCLECHPGIQRLPHEQQLYTYRCRDCHENEVENLAIGAHRADIDDGKVRPTCEKCHGSQHTLKSLTAPRHHDVALEVVELCVQCHGHTGTATDHVVKDYHDGTHGRGLFQRGLASVPTCVECHGSHSVMSAKDPRSPTHPTQAPQMCGKCHEGVVEPYLKSIHGKTLLEGKKEAASCTTCHYTHGVAPVNEKFQLAQANECAHCHAELTELYLKSYHGKATRLGDASKAICSSCHGYHDILPISDPQSRVAQGNIQATCSACHAGVNENFTKYISHDDYRDPSENPIVFWTWAIMMILVVGTLGAFIPHSLLWLQRSFFQRLINPLGPHFEGRHGPQRMVERFSPIHRYVHFMVIVSFMGLVATGFPMKYSDTVWATRLTAALGGVHTMGIIHRGLAILSFTYVGIHVIFLAYFFLFRCPKPRWRFVFGPDSLLFSWRDIRDFYRMMKWFLWLGPRPKFDRWTYFEKFDYFGEIWGTFVIGLTGMMLWMPHLFTRWLPGWILNCATVVHSTEALLAASVIFLVHFFNTHLRPERFPIDLVMLTGQMTEEEMIEERGQEYDRLVAEGRLEERIVPPVKTHVRVMGAIAGMAVFTFGIILIVLALTAEVHQFYGSEIFEIIIRKAQELLSRTPL